MTGKITQRVHDGIGTLFTAPTTTRAKAIDHMERASAATHLMSSLEHLANRKQRRKGGVNNWQVTRDSMLATSTPVRRFLDTVSKPVVTDCIHAARVASSLALLAPRSPAPVRIAANGLLAASSWALHPRHHYGTDGSDQVSFLSSAAALIARTAGRRTAVSDHVLWTVALQATLSYAVSGWAKLAGRSWREGTALAGVTRTMTYGDRRVWQLTQRFPRTARMLGASVLALECTFPLAYAAGGKFAKAYSAGTSAFHVAVGQIMGLGRFVPSFTSMHAPILYTARRTHASGDDSRNDAVPRTAAVAGLAIAIAAIAARQRNRRITLAGRGDERTLRLHDGNAITYRVVGDEADGSPVFVLENALLGTTEHWEWLVEALREHGVVVVSNRAGYGGSTAKKGTALTLDDLTDHLVQVAEHTAGSRPVVLIGHSLGGYLALEAANRLNRAPRAVCLVDSSHPDELKRSKRQELGAAALSEGLTLTAASLEAGAGLLLDVPDWVRGMPAAAQRTMLAQYRDARMWRAAKREWAAVLHDFGDTGPLSRTEVPVLSISADRTVREDDAQREMHTELAGLSSAGRHLVIPDADHDSLLTNPHHARATADEIVRFVSAPPVRAFGALKQGAA